jgi:hypothetical protein
VRGGQFVVTDVTGAKPQFQRPKGQPGTIAVGHSEESHEATVHATGNSGQTHGTAAMMAGIAGHVWSFDELFEAVLT